MVMPSYEATTVSTVRRHKSERILIGTVMYISAD